LKIIISQNDYVESKPIKKTKISKKMKKKTLNKIKKNIKDDVKNILKSEIKTENNIENEKNVFDNYKDNNNLCNKDSIKNNITFPSIEMSKSSFDNLLNETSVKKRTNKNKKNEENEITKNSLDYEEGNY
jgi:hypothetical protein